MLEFSEAELQESFDASRACPNDTLAEKFLHAHPEIRYIRYQWVDLSGVLRARCLPKDHVLELARTDQPLRCEPDTLATLIDDSVMPDIPHQGINELHPDWSSLRTLGSDYLSAFAGVMCNVVERLPENDNQPSSYKCPRKGLAKIEDLAAQRRVISFEVGFEVELVILEENSDAELQNGPSYIPLGSGLRRHCVASMRDPSFDILEKCITELVDAGVAVQDFHVQQGGQYAISLTPHSPLQAVDNFVRMQDMVKTIVAKHGYLATMALSHGCKERISISISQPDQQDFFLAGILQHLPELCAVTMPFEQSYERLMKLKGSEWAEWSKESDEEAVRKTGPGRLEFGCIDASANHYLAMATLLASGLLGVQSQRPLRAPDAPCSLADSYVFVSSEVPVLSGNFKTALQLLKAASRNLGRILPRDLLDHYVAVKEVESARVAELNEEEQEKLMVALF